MKSGKRSAVSKFDWCMDIRHDRERRCRPLFGDTAEQLCQLDHLHGLRYPPYQDQTELLHLGRIVCQKIVYSHVEVVAVQARFQDVVCIQQVNRKLESVEVPSPPGRIPSLFALSAENVLNSHHRRRFRRAFRSNYDSKKSSSFPSQAESS